jgi:hypothetical protein
MRRHSTSVTRMFGITAITGAVTIRAAAVAEAEAVTGAGNTAAARVAQVPPGGTVGFIPPEE